MIIWKSLKFEFKIVVYEWVWEENIWKFLRISENTSTSKQALRVMLNERFFYSDLPQLLQITYMVHTIDL